MSGCASSSGTISGICTLKTIPTSRSRSDRFKQAKLHASGENTGTRAGQPRTGVLLEFAEKYGRRSGGFGSPAVSRASPVPRVARETVFKEKFSQLELERGHPRHRPQNIQILDLDALKANSKF